MFGFEKMQFGDRVLQQWCHKIIFAKIALKRNRAAIAALEGGKANLLAGFFGGFCEPGLRLAAYIELRKQVSVRVNLDVLRGVYAETNSVASDFQDLDLNVVSDRNHFFLFSGNHQHGFLLKSLVQDGAIIARACQSLQGSVQLKSTEASFRSLNL